VPATATTDVKKGRPIAEVKALYPESKASMKFFNGCPNKAIYVAGND